MQGINLKRFFLPFLFAVSTNFLHAQRRTFLDDSLTVQINTTKDPKLKVDCMIRLGFLILDGTNKKKSIELLEAADSISRKINYRKGLSYSLFLQGLAEWDHGNYSAAEKKLLDGINAVEAQGIPFDLYSPLSAIRIFFNETKQYEKKLKFYRDKLRYYESYGPKENIGSCYHGIGNYYLISGNAEKSIEYYSKAGENWKLHGNKTCMITMQIIVGMRYKEWGNLDYAQKLLKGFEESAFPILPFVIYVIYNRQLAEIEIREKDYKEALDYYLELTRFSIQMGEINSAINYIDISTTYLLLHKGDSAKFYIDLATKLTEGKNYNLWHPNGDLEYDFCLASYYRFIGQNNLAFTKLKAALSQARKENYTKLILKYLEVISDFCSQTGLNAEAFHYLKEHNHLKDSIETTSQATRISIYETEQKENEIVLLNKDRKIQQQEIGRQKMVRNSFIGGFAVMLLFAGVFFAQRNKIRKGKKRSDELLLNILPSETAEELKTSGTTKTRNYDSVTVMFTDFQDFTKMCEVLAPDDLVKEIHECFSAFDHIIDKYNLEKIKTIGDSYMAAGGLPVPDANHACDIVNAGLDIQDFMRERKAVNKTSFEIRIGIHSGPVVAGIVGIKKFAYDIWGDTVNIASRMESSGEAGKVNISGSTYELVKEKFTCTYRGKIEAKKKGEVDMFFVSRSLGEG
jgi:adenylate cyclase